MAGREQSGPWRGGDRGKLEGPARSPARPKVRLEWGTAKGREFCGGLPRQRRAKARAAWPGWACLAFILTDTGDMKTAICDAEAFYPLRDLVAGPFKSLDQLADIEQFVRTVVLHDEIVIEFASRSGSDVLTMEMTPFGASEIKFAPGQQVAGKTITITFGPTLAGFDFFALAKHNAPDTNVKLSQGLVNAASRYARGTKGDGILKRRLDFLKRALGVSINGGSALLKSSFAVKTIESAEKYPAALFATIDKDWQAQAKKIQQNGLGVLVPPVLGIVLGRCSTRADIPAVICGLRDEWATARTKLWQQLDAYKNCRTLAESLAIQRELEAASRLFSPFDEKTYSRPVRFLWDIIVGAGSGAAVGSVSGSGVPTGAATGTITQIARSLPEMLHEFGPTLFSRGTFDLAKKVRRETLKIKLDTLTRILTEAEKRSLSK